MVCAQGLLVLSIPFPATMSDAAGLVRATALVNDAVTRLPSLVKGLSVLGFLTLLQRVV